MGGEGREGDS